jgi:Plasmid pRiA4b ORF-3-like protein
MADRKRSAFKVYELQVELAGITPLIWRRLWVPAEIELTELHGLLQLAMGWMNSHLHSFEIGSNTYGMADADLDELEMLDEEEYTLEKALAGSIQEFIYEYDFGDGWRHHIQVRPLEKPSLDWSYPLCVAGERSAPPEDVGGPHGYQEFLDAIRNPKHPEHKRTLTWVGGVFDPEGFDLNTINRILRYDPTDEE